MDNGTIIAKVRQWRDNCKTNQKLAVCYGLGCLLGLGWISSLLFHVFMHEHQFPMPWDSLLAITHLASHTPYENLLLWVSIGIPVSFIVWMRFEKLQHVTIASLYGDAHWATWVEIKQMGLMDNKEGLVIGKKFGRLLRADLISHALVYAPSRSGKGVSQVIPNVLTFKDSMLLIDVKDELFEITSGFRSQYGQAVFSFAPLRAGGKTHRWNVLDLVDKASPLLIAHIDLIVEIIICYSNDKDSMWIAEARTLTKGLLLWLMDSDRPFTIGELSRFIKGTTDFKGELTAIRDKAINKDGSINLHETAFLNINNFLQKADKEQSGVKSTVTARLNLWDDPLIQAATDSSDFDLRDMRKKRMTIYLGIPLNQIDRLAPLMNLFVQMFVSVMTEKLPQANEPYKVLAILDEFCALGRMETLKKSFGFLAGYHVHLMAIIQNVGQFYDLYGGRDKSDIFFQNTDYKIAYFQNTHTDQEFVSQQLGMRHIKARSTSFSNSGIGSVPSGSNVSHGSKPLLSPDQVRTFPKTQGIAVFNGKPPIRYERIIYYKEKIFQDRLLPPIEIAPIRSPVKKLIAKKSPKSQPQTFEKKMATVLMPKIQHSIHQQMKKTIKSRKKVVEERVFEDLEVD